MIDIFLLLNCVHLCSIIMVSYRCWLPSCCKIINYWRIFVIDLLFKVFVAEPYVHLVANILLDKKKIVCFENDLEVAYMFNNK